MTGFLGGLFVVLGLIALPLLLGGDTRQGLIFLVVAAFGAPVTLGAVVVFTRVGSWVSEGEWRSG